MVAAETSLVSAQSSVFSVIVGSAAEGAGKFTREDISSAFYKLPSEYSTWETEVSGKRGDINNSCNES